MLKLSILHYEDLSMEEQDRAPDKGQGKEKATYLLVRHGNRTIALESDAMEPERANFTGDLTWILDLLARCYQLGVSTGLKLPIESPFTVYTTHFKPD